MSCLKRNLVFLGLVLFPAFASAGGKTVVTNTPSFYRAAAEACVGSAIGAQCTITFQGGSVSIGVCVQVPGPAGGYLSCEIDPSQIPSCKKNSLVNSPSTMALFAVLAGGLFFLRRRRGAY